MSIISASVAFTWAESVYSSSFPFNGVFEMRGKIYLFPSAVLRTANLWRQFTGVQWLCGLRAHCAHTLLTHLTHRCIQRLWLFPANHLPFSYSQSCSCIRTKCFASFRHYEKRHLGAGRRVSAHFVPLSTHQSFPLDFGWLGTFMARHWSSALMLSGYK